MGYKSYKAMMLAAALLFVLAASSQVKREFRGTWIQCVNGQFENLGTEQMQRTLTYQLDRLQQMNVNAVIFQVRPECDALYESSIEPWSRFLTGRQGVAPTPYWDPLQWMIDECHKRNMELHAWINPYRARTKPTKQLADNHIAKLHPERCFEYDGLLLLNPGMQENRDYICRVVKDIVQRYDVDGLHIDDYFYPYPAAGQVIPDQHLFRIYSNGLRRIEDWRRYNVDLFVEQLSRTIHQTKPWVKFGVSPFGIYRNKKNSSIGSNTNGLQNYDDLYADVLLWVNNGWVDYNVPQLYWEIGHKAADYKELIGWWNRYAARRPLYIGEDVERTVKHADPDNPQTHQQLAKHVLHQVMPHVQGTVLWYAKAVVDNPGNYATMLQTRYWRYPALQPRMSFIDGKAPKKVKRLAAVWIDGGYHLFWTAPKWKKWGDQPMRYVVYRFLQGERVTTNDPSHIVCITSECHMQLPYQDGTTTYVYAVTALDRLQNESGLQKLKVKL